MAWYGGPTGGGLRWEIFLGIGDQGVLVGGGFKDFLFSPRSLGRIP